MQTSKLEWTTQLNFTRNVNEVVELTPLLADGVYTLTDGGVNNYDMVIRKGIPYGEIGGKGLHVLQRLHRGRCRRRASGWRRHRAGQPCARLHAGLEQHHRNFGNFSVGVLIDGRFGGEVMSVTQAVFDRFGASQATADARDAGGVDVKRCTGRRFGVHRENGCRKILRRRWWPRWHHGKRTSMMARAFVCANFL